MKVVHIFSIAFLWISFISCSSYQKMKTVIQPGGTIIKEFYVKGDSLFMGGVNSRNPFLFEWSNEWNLHRGDWNLYPVFSEKDVYFNLMARREFLSLEEVSENLPVFSAFRSLVVPRESLSKRFRWFYTYYEYKAFFPAINPDLPVAIESYLQEEELKLWLQGDPYLIQGLNGVELNLLLNEIEEMFFTWVFRNYFEVSLNLLESVSDGEMSVLSASGREEIFTEYIKSFSQLNLDTDPDLYPAGTARLLDNKLNTNVYSHLYKAHKEFLDKAMEEREAQILEIFEINIAYEVELPGTLLGCNTSLRMEGNPLWKVNAYRILTVDYTLSAQSRKANPWAFLVTGVLVVVTMSSYRVYRKKSSNLSD